MSKLPPQKHEENPKNASENTVRPKEKVSRKVFRDSMILAALLIIITFMGYSILELQRQIQNLEDKSQSKNEIPDFSILEEKIRKLEIALASKPSNIESAEVEKLINDKIAEVEKKIEGSAANQATAKELLHEVFILTSLLKNRLWQGNEVAEVVAKLKKVLSDRQMLQGDLQNNMDMLQSLTASGHKANEIYNIPSDQAALEEKNLPSYLSWLHGFIKISSSTQSEVPGIADHVRQLVLSGNVEEAQSLVVRHIEQYPAVKEKWDGWLHSAQLVQNTRNIVGEIERAVLERIGE